MCRVSIRTLQVQGHTYTQTYTHGIFPYRRIDPDPGRNVGLDDPTRGRWTLGLDLITPFIKIKMIENFFTYISLHDTYKQGRT